MSLALSYAEHHDARIAEMKKWREDRNAMIQELCQAGVPVKTLAQLFHLRKTTAWQITRDVPRPVLRDTSVSFPVPDRHVGVKVLIEKWAPPNDLEKELIQSAYDQAPIWEEEREVAGNPARTANVAMQNRVIRTMK